MKKKKKINPQGIIIAIILLFAIFLILLLKFLIPKTFLVNFDSKGGTTISSIKVKENDIISEPNNPQKEGFSFEGWYLNDELFDFNTKITQNIVLEAHWESSSPKITKIVLANFEINLKINENRVIKYTIEPDNATDKTIKFKSSDPTIVSVDSNGNVKGLKKGEAIITLTSNDGSVKTSLKVIVSEETTKEILPTSISISGSSTMVVGKILRLTASIKPTNATNKEVIWKSSDELVATVDQQGNVKALKPGVVVITVTTVAENKKATKKITISAENTNPSETQVDIADITISGDKEINVGSKIKLNVNVSPDNATDKTVIWSSSNEAVATVDQDGNVLGIAPGTVKITASSKDGKVNASHEIIVKEDEPIYILYLKAINMDSATGSVSQYSFRITKNNTDFTDYEGFNYNNKTILKANKTIRAADINKEVKTATLVLAAGSKVKVEVRYE